MEFTITSGRVVEKRRTYLAVSRPAERRGKKASPSSEKKIRSNEKECVKELARVLNCNMSKGDMWVTLRFAEEISWEEAETRMKKFLRKARELTKAEGKQLVYIWSPGKKSPRSGEETKPHFHICMNRIAWETVQKLWPEGEVTYRIIDGRGDYTGIARYMVSNAGHEEKGKRAWNASRGIKRPVYSEPVIVLSAKGIKAEKGAEIMENVLIQEEDGYQHAYIRYIKPERQDKRGGRKCSG